MSIVKLAALIQGGAHSNKKSAWKHSKMLSGRSDLPLAVGINKFAEIKMKHRRKSMSIVKCAASNYMGSVYERAADQLAIDKATDREMDNVKGPYVTGGITLGALGALAGGYAHTKPGVGAAIGGSLGLLSGLGLAYGVKRGRAQESALSKNKQLAKKHELLQKLQQIEMASNPHYYYY